MKLNILKIISKQAKNDILAQKSTFWLMGFMGALILFALVTGFVNMNAAQNLAEENSHKIREKWEDNPAKHPHRMAHYGYVVFRKKHPLSFFDFGMDSYLGNTIFLEAHKQNTANFSEASLNGGLLRFGEISASMILTFLLPLLIFFWGFGLVAQERENGTLKLLLNTGIAWKDIIFGKTWGLFLIGLYILLPTFVLSAVFLSVNKISYLNPEILIRFFTLIAFYLLYLLIVSFIAVLVSAKSQTAKASLISLIGIWLLFTLVLPKLSQVAGQTLYPSPTKIEFDVAVEAELVKQGDSHNPNDPHYKAIKDSLLQQYKVATTKELPFNFSGYIMKEGERLSANTFATQQAQLTNIYRKQQLIPKTMSFINPYMAIKMLSMGLCGTDFETFNDFQNQAEQFRYKLAQTMNDLQIKYISNNVKNSADPQAILNQKFWKDFPDFEYKFLAMGTTFKLEIIAFSSILIWVLGLLVWNKFGTKKLKSL